MRPSKWIGFGFLLQRKGRIRQGWGEWGGGVGGGGGEWARGGVGGASQPFLIRIT